MSGLEITILLLDKLPGIIFPDKEHYMDTLNKIISGKTIFHEITEPIFFKFTLRIEDKINAFFRRLKTQKIISDCEYRKIFVSGSTSGTLYGLPKIHKPDLNSKFQYKPIFAALGKPKFNLAEFLVPILNPYTTN